jgi:hypothetical protein
MNIKASQPTNKKGKVRAKYLAKAVPSYIDREKRKSEKYNQATNTLT